MALGSWRTFEQIPREQGVEVMVAAREAGITFLDDARYNDETGNAPMPTGYSEVVFGELFRAAGWVRSEVTVSNKLWWEHWPRQSASEELDGSLERMGFDQLDLLYAMPPPDGLTIDALVEEVAGLIASGRARAWGTGMWSAAQHHEALEVLPGPGSAATGRPRRWPPAWSTPAGPDDPSMRRAFDDGPIGLVASYVLAGGTLSGKYLRGGDGRATGDDGGVMAKGKALAPRVVELAAAWGVPPSHVAMAHAFAHPNLVSLLFGARTPEQLRENVAAWATFESPRQHPTRRRRRTRLPSPRVVRALCAGRP